MQADGGEEQHSREDGYFGEFGAVEMRGQRWGLSWLPRMWHVFDARSLCYAPHSMPYFGLVVVLAVDFLPL